MSGLQGLATSFLLALPSLPAWLRMALHLSHPFFSQSFGNICIPALQSLALNAIRSEYNGRIMSAFAIMEGTAMVTRGPAFAAIYNLSVSRLPNLVFFVGAVRR